MSIKIPLALSGAFLLSGCATQFCCAPMHDQPMFEDSEAYREQVTIVDARHFPGYPNRNFKLVERFSMNCYDLGKSGCYSSDILHYSTATGDFTNGRSPDWFGESDGSIGSLELACSDNFGFAYRQHLYSSGVVGAGEEDVIPQYRRGPMLEALCTSDGPK
jgi:hypothetical protein